MVSQRKLSKISSIVLLLFAAVMLFFAQSAYWVNHTVFNQASFSKIASSALLEESSRNAISVAVVDAALADRPLVQRTVGDRIVSFTNGLLGSDVSNQAIKTVTTKTYAYVTTPNRQDIVIDLEGIKAPLSSIITLAQSMGRGENLENINEKIPDEIKLIESDSFPDLSGWVRAMLWLGPLFWILSIGGFAWYIYLGRRQYARRVYAVGLAIIVVSIVGILLVPFVPPPLSAMVSNINLRPVVENLTTGFLAPFAVQMYWMLGVTLFALLVFSQRFNILRLVRQLESSLTKDKPKKDAE